MKNTLQQSRCLNCSLLCPIAISLGADGKAIPEYVTGDSAATGGRLCFRGHYVSELINHPRRFSSAWVRNGSVAETDLESALDATVAALREAARDHSVAVLVDGNFPCEEIVRAVTFVKDCLGCDAVAVYVPPTDEGLLKGYASVDGTGCDAAALEQVSTVLAVGDVFSTHPVLAKPILDAVKQTKQGKLLAIDSMVGRTMRHAAKRYLIRPDGEAAALGAIACAAAGSATPLVGNDVSLDDLASRAGLDAAAVQEIASDLQGASGAAVALSIGAGRTTQAPACAAGAAVLQGACRTKTLLLCTYGNAAGALAASAASGALPLGTWLRRLSEKPAKVVLAIGTDLVGMSPDSVSQAVFGKAQTVISAASMPGATSARADIVLPLAAPWETDGSVMTPAGERIEVRGLVAPPGGAMTLTQLLDELGQRIDGTARSGTAADNTHIDPLATNLDKPVIALDDDDSPQGTLSMISRTGHFDLHQGSTSRQLEWTRLMESEPYVLISPQDASALGVRSGDAVRMSTPGGVTTLSARIDDSVAAGTLAATAGLPDTRNLFPWRVRPDELIDIGPATVGIEVVRSTQ